MGSWETARVRVKDMLRQARGEGEGLAEREEEKAALGERRGEAQGEGVGVAEGQREALKVAACEGCEGEGVGLRERLAVYVLQHDAAEEALLEA